MDYPFLINTNITAFIASGLCTKSELLWIYATSVLKCKQKKLPMVIDSFWQKKLSRLANYREFFCHTNRFTVNLTYVNSLL